MKTLPVCSPFNSEQNNVPFRYLDRIFAMFSTPEGNVILTGKIARGQTGPMALNDIGTVKRPYKLDYVKKSHIFGLSVSRNTQMPS